MKTLSTLRERAFSERVGTVCAAISEMVQHRMPLLSEADLSAVESRNDELISGWLFVYRSYWSAPEERKALILSALVSSNPRIREQACDVIGDLKLTELAYALQPLTTDPVPYVAEAARYNHAALAD
ncbi:MAG: hypothetical protein AB9M53_03740 [Leptothrix sp. (in: b-proteobacteria)]